MTFKEEIEGEDLRLRELVKRIALEGGDIEQVHAAEEESKERQRSIWKRSGQLSDSARKEIAWITGILTTPYMPLP